MICVFDYLCYANTLCGKHKKKIDPKIHPSLVQKYKTNAVVLNL